MNNYQPKFWLQITEAYVIENFEELISYINHYIYSPEEHPESDFNRSVDYLSKTARSIIDVALKNNLDESPIWEMGNEKAVRIVGASILAEQKRGRTAYDLITGMVLMLLAIHSVQSQFIPQLINILNSCARKLTLRTLPFSFRNLEKEIFSVPSFAINFSKLDWNENNEAEKNVYYEGKGTVLINKTGVQLVTLNHDDTERYINKLRCILESDLKISVLDRDLRRFPSDSPCDVINQAPYLLHALSSLQPSRQKSKKIYSEDAMLDVRVVYKNGIKLVCESIDPDFETVTGKLLMAPLNLGISRDYLLSNIKEGDIIPVIYQPTENCIFRFSDSTEEELDFKTYLEQNHSCRYLRAVYFQDYAYGSRWLSETGMTINVLHKYDDKIDFNHFVNEEGTCVRIKVDEIKEDNKGNIVVNGQFLEDSEQIEPDVIYEYFENDAYNYMARSFLNYMNDSYQDMETIPSGRSDYISVDSFTVNVLARLLLESVMIDLSLSSVEKVARIMIGMSLFECVGDETNKLISQRELAFLNAAISFASGKSPMSLVFNVNDKISNNQRSKLLMSLVETLKRYKETHHSFSVSENLKGERYDQIEDLVNASNTLIDKIELSELSRIKKTIATRLGVGDTFREIVSSHVFYGYESETLEFKISCVLPPQNRKTDSFQGNLAAQTFTILKTICAFLNSPSGGDLLIGVNDEGYAVGVGNDIDLLYGNKLIAERSADRLRIYLKNLIDRSFITNDGNVSGNAVSVGHLWVNIEQTRDGKEIIRIKVTPYPYDVVRILKEFVPKGNRDVFYRTSGSSEPLDSSGIRNVRLNKIAKLDPNDYKIALILEAIDRKKQLLLRNYHSASGRSDRRIEPHMLMTDNLSVQAYDHSSKEMRMFRLSRMGNLEMMPNNWEAEKKHRSLEVDVFGMCQSAKFDGKNVRVKMSDFALLLFFEEYPRAKSSENARICENTGSDRKKFPYIVEMTVFDPNGVMRFVRGLPELTKLEEGTFED